jgi:vacuolar-type H+-ATPase subunit C/Vma6
MRRYQMDLLQHPEDRGYPVEYLLSRIRGRGAGLIKDWDPLIYHLAPVGRVPSEFAASVHTDRSPEAVWKKLAREYRWVYTRMDEQYRGIFLPFFFYAELRTLIICLRQVKEKKTGRADELLRASLLADKIKNVLMTSPDIPPAVAGLERVLSAYSAGFRGLAKAFNAAGQRGVEQRLVTACLADAVDGKQDPVMRGFFMRLIDSRNVMSFYKYFRMKMESRPSFIKGGGISERRLRDQLVDGDRVKVSALIRSFTGIRIETPDPASVETALYKGMTRFLRRAGREPFGAGPILDYLWRCSNEARNLSILAWGKNLDRDTVEAELVV